MVKKSGSADQLIAVILKGIEEVKGKDIDILDLREIENTFATISLYAMVPLTHRLMPL